MSRAVVVGGGITGLTAAFTLYRDNVDVELVEASDRLGGKILTTEVRGVSIDAGPDAFLVREPHMTDLCDQLHIGNDLVAPATGSARIWHRGALRPLPAKQYLGVPLDLESLEGTGLLSEDALHRAASDLEAPADAPADDETVGSLVRRRLGDEVMERLVAPLLGGINAGDADRLSLQAGVPQLAAAAAHDPSLIKSIRTHLAEAQRDPDAPIFLTHPLGVSHIVEVMANHVAGRVNLDQPIQSLEPAEAGWVVHGRSSFDAESVVLAAPAFASAAILRSVAPETAAMLDCIDYASVVMVTLAFATKDLPELIGSGFLVPRSEGLLMTACSQASVKWAHLGDGPTTYLRVSAGHSDDEQAMAIDDDELVDQILRELQWTLRIFAEPREVRITRWPSSLPQYQPGHLDRVTQIEASLRDEAPGVFVAGAAFRGLGLPACVQQGRQAAASVLDHLGIEPPEPRGPGVKREV